MKICNDCGYFLDYPHWKAYGNERDLLPINYFDGMCRVRCIGCDKGYSCGYFVSKDELRQYND